MAENKADTIVNRMIMAILMGKLKPRERLVESELIERFHGKRFSIRKAIQELVHLGFVEFTPNKGARVIDVTEDELEDLYSVRLNLELLAAELLIKKITPEKLSILWKIHKNYIEAMNNDLIEKIIMLNEEFHRTLYAMTENRFLLKHLDTLKNSIFFLRYHTFISLGFHPKSIAQHEAIIKALEARDLEKLKLCVIENIISPEMIHNAKKSSQPGASGAKVPVAGPVLGKRRGIA
jgi:DNA-binding GntR family transcriptional regulator